MMDKICRNEKNFLSFSLVEGEGDEGALFREKLSFPLRHVRYQSNYDEAKDDEQKLEREMKSAASFREDDKKKKEI